MFRFFFFCAEGPKNKNRRPYGDDKRRKVIWSALRLEKEPSIDAGSLRLRFEGALRGRRIEDRYVRGLRQ